MVTTTSLNNDVKATTMSDDSLAFTETVDMTVGNITMHNAYIGGTRSVCSTSKRCKEGWTYVQTHDHAAFIDPTDPQKHIPLIPETHGDVNLWTLPTTVTPDGECNHELQMAMRKAETIHEELKRNMHLEHLKEQHTTKDPKCKSCQEGLMTRTPAKSKEDDVRGTEAGYVLGVDFMGPFTKSINGKQWCMVAVDAKHGYTIVKTLQDKKAKTVKTAMQEIVCDFQVAIGKGNTFVVRVHSDNDNSLIAEVKDYLRKECIEQTFTEPYDHNANARVERKNRKLLGIFRTCLIEATQGSGKYKELWCVGLEHAAMASNQAPESGEKSPAARIGAREWDFQKHFNVFGAQCTAWEPLEQRDDKMEQVAGKAIWLGLSQDVSGAHVVAPLQWDSETRQWDIESSKVCRTVQVNNNVYRQHTTGHRNLVLMHSFQEHYMWTMQQECHSKGGPTLIPGLRGHLTLEQLGFKNYKTNRS